MAVEIPCKCFREKNNQEFSIKNQQVINYITNKLSNLNNTCCTHHIVPNEMTDFKLTGCC